jgi:hypothetical protein
MRMSMRRFTRVINAFSKKVENNAMAIALYLMYYDFGGPSDIARDPGDRGWSVEEIVGLLR